MTSQIRVSATRTEVRLHGAGAMCAEAGAGHDMHILQRRLAAATPSRWVDVIAGDADGDGWLDLVGLDGSVLTRVWHHAHLGGLVRPGEPVALHEGYHVLAIAGSWVNVQDERDPR